MEPTKEGMSEWYLSEKWFYSQTRSSIPLKLNLSILFENGCDNQLGNRNHDCEQNSASGDNLSRD